MVGRDILYEADGVLSLGREGRETLRPQELLQVVRGITAPQVMRVVHGREEVGLIQAQFVAMHDFQGGALCFRLAGRAWLVGLVDWARGVLHVRPAEQGRVPSWRGLPGALSFSVCQAMRDVLVSPGEESAWLTPSAGADLAALRETYDFLDGESAPLENQPDGVQWHTFAGGGRESPGRCRTGEAVRGAMDGGQPLPALQEPGRRGRRAGRGLAENARVAWDGGGGGSRNGEGDGEQVPTLPAPGGRGSAPGGAPARRGRHGRLPADCEGRARHVKELRATSSLSRRRARVRCSSDQSRQSLTHGIRDRLRKPAQKLCPSLLPVQAAHLVGQYHPGHTQAIGTGTSNG